MKSPLHIAITLVLFLFWNDAFAQLERRTVVQNRPVEQTFMAPRNINLYTVQNLSKGELHYSIMHTFGEVKSGYQNLWGIDSGANVRFSFEYGLSNKLSVGIGRSSLDKLVDLSGRYHILKQTTQGDMPVSVSFAGTLGINTSQLGFVENLGLAGYSVADRLSFAGSLLVARKFSENLSLQVSPTAVWFNRVGFETNIEDGSTQGYVGLGLSGRYKIRPRTALTLQYIPTLNQFDKNHNIAVGIDIETGGHVFQMFFTTTPALNDQYLVAGSNGSFIEREFRFGFNVNRLFQIGAR